MREDRTALVALLQITLMIGMTLSNMYFIDESDGIAAQDRESIISKIIEFFSIIPSVSAIEEGDFSQGVQTCVKAKNGQFCQEMLLSDCASKCDGACIPATISNVPECKPGTCYAPKQGTCQIGASKISCESSGGQWNSDPNGNIPQCKRGCCILGSQAAFVGSQECTALSAQLGVAKTFKADATTEAACLALSNSDAEGACVIEEDGENTCKFTTKAACLKISGEFSQGYLCSAPQLNTNCERQTTAKCIDGKDELYWFDSCGNKENIYSANKEQSWNSGKVLSKSASCDVSGNKATCGNCNYLLGTVCGAKTDNQKLSDNTINYVCRDLSCKDENGETRKNGESWCAFDSSIGVDQGRSTDVAGSRHFRKVCIDGEVRTEPCQDFRNGICVETEDTNVPGGFSSAACRLNDWQKCIAYNFNNETDKCALNPDCFLNQVKVSSTYDFKVCAPKYNPGFDLSSRSESAQGICSIASQKCTVVYVKGFLSGYKCKQNCECLEKNFAEQLTNLCVSLGDCGPKANYAGKQTDNYRISNSPKLSSTYLAGLVKYKDPVRGQKALPGDDSALGSGSLGIPSDLPAGAVVGSGENAIGLASTVGGAIGVTAAIMAYAAPHLFSAGSSALAFFAGAGQVSGGIGAGGYSTVAAGSQFTAGAGGASVSSLTSGTTTVLTAGEGGTIGAGGSLTAAPGSAGAAGAQSVAAHSTFAAFGGAVAGAGIGLTITSLLLKLTGVGAGLSSGMTYALLGVGAASGAIIGYNLVATGTWTGTTAAGSTASGAAFGSGALGVVAVWAAVVIVAIIVVMKILGVGKTKTVVVDFQCQPWQAPTGGADCNKCGKNGLPCSKYSCQALGQTCQIVNEGTESEACVDVSPNDVSAPVISPLQEALLQGFSYSGATSEGYTVQGPQGCVPAFTNVMFGIAVNEPAQCKFDVAHTSAYKDMEFSFGGSNLYRSNHSMVLNIPSLESLGVDDLNATSQATYNLYVRCQDRNGNANIREYAINFCVSQGADVTPPVVIRGAPYNNIIAYNAQTANISVLVSEPATCKISTTDLPYDSMQTMMSCSGDAVAAGLFPYSCNTIQPFQGNSTTYYVRCADQPWLNETDIAGGKKHNTNGQSLQIPLRKSINNLKIDYLEPNNRTITSNVQPATVEITATTSGGVDGTAICYLKIGENYIQFLNTGARSHSWALNQMTAGNKTAQVRCIDDAGNVAEKSSSFSVVIDDRVPIITRVYGKDGVLNVVTDEASECSYSTQTCDFEYEQGTVMSGIDRIHTSSLDSNKDYYISCKDRLGNKAGQCMIAVRKGELENA